MENKMYIKKWRGGKKESKKDKDTIQTCIPHSRAESKLKTRLQASQLSKQSIK